MKARIKAAAKRARDKQRKERAKEEERAKEARAKARARAKAKQAARIPRAPQPQNLYIKVAIAEARASGKLPTPATREALNNIFLEANKRFKELTPAERQPYIDRAAAAKAELDARRAKQAEERKARALASPYNVFFKEAFPAIRATNPGLKPTELTAKVAERWRSMPEAARHKYVEIANAERRARGHKLLASAAAVAQH
ncbi:hypothetical protein GPECTOR_14g120 [Gonium pectorale]|uniref:HMG box domain-containing protein n=1 Tax=Gonium pectorale TaxID=33097 RepID=A0A150GNF0_GONPE|nr:hypothetical protein GPECTOR_14g120 [Gonium pectorale]|eukprot:KXZ50870.1 hypothetical protein GPECTOR_14g120 [Gonium pectorale]